MTDNNTLIWSEPIVVKSGGSIIPVEYADKILEVIVDSSLDMPDMCIVHLLETDDFKITGSSTFDLGKDLEIELPIPDRSKTTVKVFKGEIIAIEPTFNMDQSATVTIRAYDKSHRLNRGTKTRVYQDVTDGDIVRKIASETGLSPQVQDPGQVYKHVYQHNLTDMAFLTQRAHRIGYEVLVDDTKLYFRKFQGSRGSAGEMEWGKGLFTFKPRLSVWRQVDKVIVKGWNPDTKEALVGQASSSQVAPSVGLGKTGGDFHGLFQVADGLPRLVPFQEDGAEQPQEIGVRSVFLDGIATDALGLVDLALLQQVQGLVEQASRFRFIEHLGVVVV